MDIKIQKRLQKSARHFSKQALKNKTGARGLKRVLEDSMLDIMYEIPETNIAECLITKEVIASGAPPRFTRKKPGASAKSSVKKASSRRVSASPRPLPKESA